MTGKTTTRRARRNVQRSFGGTITIGILFVVAGILAIGGPLSRTASATAVTQSGLSDATGSLSPGSALRWTHTPAGTPSLATVVCAAHATGVLISATYGAAAMKAASSVQQSNLFLGLLYRLFPPSGAQTVTVNLAAVMLPTAMNKMPSPMRMVGTIWKLGSM